MKKTRLKQCFRIVVSAVISAVFISHPFYPANTLPVSAESGAVLAVDERDFDEYVYENETVSAGDPVNPAESTAGELSAEKLETAVLSAEDVPGVLSFEEAKA